MGGGSYQTQIEELENIACHLNIRYSSNDIDRIAKQLFGGTATFRKGAIGNWPDHFSHEHKCAFKEISGHLIISLGYESDNNW